MCGALGYVQNKHEAILYLSAETYRRHTAEKSSKNNLSMDALHRFPWRKWSALPLLTQAALDVQVVWWDH